MNRIKVLLILASLFLLNLSFALYGQSELLDRDILEKIAGEISGKLCYEHIRDLSVFNRWYGSDDMEKAALQVAAKAKKYHLQDAHLEKFRVDSETYYWMQKPWLAWNCTFGELRMVKPHSKLIASYEANGPCVLVYSRDADVEAEVVYVGKGTELRDYEGKNVRGKIVLASGDPWDASEIAMNKMGAAGLLSGLGMDQMGYSSNTVFQMRMKPWNQDRNRLSTFGFSLSANQARSILSLLNTGEKVILQAKVKAEVREHGYHQGVVATIRGTTYPDEEIIMTAHLDHPRPGAHDNNSGCAVLLEIARALNVLIERRIIEPPQRTLRFYWNPHVWGCDMLFSTYPELLSRTIAGINVDCVGLDQTKISSELLVGLPPYSRASFLQDVFNNILDYLVQNNNVEAGTLNYRPKTIDQDGTRNVFNGRAVPFFGYSDHIFFNSGNIRIPAAMINEQPPGSHHSQNDKIELLDPTQLKRVAFLVASAAYSIASSGPEESYGLIDEIYHRGRGRLEREMKIAKSILRDGEEKNIGLAYKSAKNLVIQGFKREFQALASTGLFIKGDKKASSYLAENLKEYQKFESDCLSVILRLYQSKCARLNIKTQEAPLSEEELILRKIVPSLNKELKGMYGILNEYPEEKYQMPDGHLDNPSYYELFNLMDGCRNMLDIFLAVQAEALSADYQPLSFKETMMFLEQLKEAGVIFFKN